MMQSNRKDVTCYVSPFFKFLIFTSVQTRLIKNFQFQRTTVTARNKRYKPDPVSCIQTSLRISLELTAVISSFKLDSCQRFVFKSPWKFFLPPKGPKGRTICKITYIGFQILDVPTREDKVIPKTACRTFAVKKDVVCG